ncbi:hypothetical protein [Streptomyces sp. F63]|uniref:hypothetical protein n=1 Tax=Streptomyces sp. F63 TaxID=2824887 RepID=UPI0027DD5EF1|nr:hypothetical protein [Streptomyces sp. F63]
MSDRDDWRWEYDPDAEHVVAGLPPQVVAEVERLAGEMVALAEVGIDVTDLGEGPGGAYREGPGVSRSWPTAGSTRCPFPACGSSRSPG